MQYQTGNGIIPSAKPMPPCLDDLLCRHYRLKNDIVNEFSPFFVGTLSWVTPKLGLKVWRIAKGTAELPALW